MILYSVILPVYNAERYLRACLESILAQTYSAFELIVVDDGSADGSALLLDEYREKVEKKGDGERQMVVLRQEHLGVSAARNAGLKMARGEYVCFVDADDTVGENWLADYHDAITTGDYDLVRLADGRAAPAKRTIESREDLLFWGWREFISEGFPWLWAIRREVALKAEFPVGVGMAEDQLYAARLLPHLCRVLQLDRCGYNYRRNENSTSRTPLPSEDRVIYFNELRRLVERDWSWCSHEPATLSRIVALATLTWADRPKDKHQAREIRDLWRWFAARGLARADAVRPLFRSGYWLYAKTGLVWPMTAWAGIVRVMVFLKRGVCKRR